ncbi:MAG: phage portal protein [Devosiaceae bacterium]
MFWTRTAQVPQASDTARHTGPAQAHAGPANVHAAKMSALPGREPLALPLFQLHTPGSPVWTDTGYASLARHAYCRNPIAFRAVRMIAEAAGSVKLVLRSSGQEYDDHWLMALLNSPGPYLSRTSLFETLAAHLLLEGNAYLMGSFNAGFDGGKPTSLYPLRPDRVRVKAGADGWPVGYHYSVGRQKMQLDADPETGLMPLAHVRHFHPLDDHYGQGCLEPARSALDLHQGASNWNKALLDNAARPSGALVYSGGNGHLDGEAFERLKGELESTYQGEANAGRPLLLEGGLDWRPMSMTPKDMDFQEARHGAMREIALAFGVPPLLLGLPGDNTFANYAEAQRALWRQTVLPLVGKLLDGITHWLAPLSPDETLDLAVDLDAIEALSGEREALWRRVSAATFLTDEEKRMAVGYGQRAEPASAPESVDG